VPGPTPQTHGNTVADEHPSGRVGWKFIALYAISYTGGSLLFLAPLLVSLALKVNDLVGLDAAPRNLALVTGIGSLLSIAANPPLGGGGGRPPPPGGGAANQTDSEAGHTYHSRPASQGTT
jgi:hypothetical protein